jgi:hypothetical protein
MTKLLALALILVFLYVCMYGKTISINYPCVPSTIHQLSADTYFVGSLEGHRSDYIGTQQKGNTYKWITIDKPVNTKTCCACSCDIDEGNNVIFIGRTDGIYIYQKDGTIERLVARDGSSSAICVADYFGDGRPSVYVSMRSGANIFLVRENEKWNDLTQQYQLESDGDTKNAMFVKFSDDMLPDVVCLTFGKIFIYPNSAIKIGEPIELSVPGFANNFCVGDFGNEGNQSIAVSATGGIYILYNRGGRTFSKAEKIYGHNFYVSQFIAYDINNNGRIDVVGDVALLNNGSKSFHVSKKYHTQKKSLSMMVVDGVEAIVSDDGKICKNIFGNSNRTYVKRSRSLKNANENILCRYNDGVLTIQNFVHSGNNVPYYKIGNAKNLIEQPKIAVAQ